MRRHTTSTSWTMGTSCSTPLESIHLGSDSGHIPKFKVKRTKDTLSCQVIECVITKALIWDPTTNENPQKPSTKGIYQIFTEINLIDLHTAHYPNQIRPPMHIHRSTPINLCRGSTEFKEALVAARYLPFGLPKGCKGDHIMLGLDFKVDILFNQLATTLYQVPTQGVFSSNNKLVQQFCTQVITQCQA